MHKLQCDAVHKVFQLLPAQKRRHPVLAACLGCITITFALSLLWIAYSGQVESVKTLAYRIPWGDKLFHLLASFTLAVLLNLTLAGRRVQIGPLSLFLGSVLLVPLVTLEESFQLFLRHRVFSLMDLASNYLGVIVFEGLALCWLWTVTAAVRSRQARKLARAS